MSFHVQVALAWFYNFVVSLNKYVRRHAGPEDQHTLYLLHLKNRNPVTLNF